MRVIFFALLMVAVGACVDPYVFEPGSVPDIYVIYGKISDQPGPYTVTIATGRPVDRSEKSHPVTGAEISISDNAGFSEVLTDLGDGTYRTNSIQGVVGRTYSLSIKTAHGEVYASTPEQIRRVGNFSNLQATFRQNVDSTSILREEVNGFDITLDAEFDPEQEALALWKWSGTYEFKTNPEFRGFYIGTKIWVPDPPPCSGFVVRGNVYAGQGFLVKIKECSCCSCWHTEYNRKPLVSVRDEVRRNETKNVFLGFVPVGLYKFTTKFVMIVSQESVSPGVYAFWNTVKKSNNEGSSFFQVPPPTTKGNIEPTSPGARPAVGVFSAVSVKYDTLSILRSEIPYDPGTHELIRSSCIGFYGDDLEVNVKPAWY